ncbi:MAG TPA: zf-HC2 domain-containing protein [Pyrinomonadaceae bacterium]|jgi:anti-sigma factor RsiW
MMNFERDNSSTCERTGDLVSVLYGEASEPEKREFEVHLKQCGSCRAEFAAFAGLRESIGEWRDQALGGFVSSSAAVVPARKSAVAALRQFFDLSPLWMKAAVGFAAVVFCVLVALAVGRFQSTAEVPRVATTNPDAVYTEQDVQRIVQQALAKQEREQVVEASGPVKLMKPSSPKDSNIAKAPRLPQSRRPFSRAERDQLAAELRLLSTSEENDLELVDK